MAAMSRDADRDDRDERPLRRDAGLGPAPVLSEAELRQVAAYVHQLGGGE
jgi:hypothetical protein